MFKIFPNLTQFPSQIELGNPFHAQRIGSPLAVEGLCLATAEHNQCFFRPPAHSCVHSMYLHRYKPNSRRRKRGVSCEENAPRLFSQVCDRIGQHLSFCIPSREHENGTPHPISFFTHVCLIWCVFLHQHKRTYASAWCPTSHSVSLERYNAKCFLIDCTSYIIA